MPLRNLVTLAQSLFFESMFTPTLAKSFSRCARSGRHRIAVNSGTQKNKFDDSLRVAHSPGSLPSMTTSAFGRSRPAADASREVVECWLLDGLR